MAARVRGVLDFGDSLIGPVAQDVAVAACYQLGGRRRRGTDLLAPALDVVAGYHAADPLRPADLPLIAEFIVVRLAPGSSSASGTRRGPATPGTCCGGPRRRSRNSTAWAPSPATRSAACVRPRHARGGGVIKENYMDAATMANAFDGSRRRRLQLDPGAHPPP